MVLAVSSASPALRRPALAVIKIRTQKWHYFFANGLPAGYSPLTLPVDPAHPVHLRWISANGRGEADLQLKEFETKTLEDSDFSH